MERKHHRLMAWQKSIDLVKEIYLLTAAFPRHEVYGLTSQMRRAVISVPSNIAEGAARTSIREFMNFLSIARGSLSELETQIIISKRLGFLDDDQKINQLTGEVFALLGGLINSLQRQ